MSLIATPAAVNADSYVTVSETDAYFALSQSKSDWAGMANDDKELLLKESTRLLDQLFSWSGTIDRSSEQSLRWPRVGAYDEDQRLIPPTAIPKAIKYGTFEFAYHLFKNGGFDVSANSLDRLSVGPIRLDFSKSIRDNSFPKMVLDLVSSVGELKAGSGGGISQARLVRV